MKSRKQSISFIWGRVFLVGLLSNFLLISFSSQAAIYSEDEDNLLFPSFSNNEILRSYDKSSFSELENIEYEKQFKNALFAFKENRVEEALTIAKSLNDRYPENVDPLKLMAAAYMRMGQWNKAKVELEKVLKLDSKESSAKKNLAIIEMQTGSTQRSRELLQSMLKDAPDEKELIKLLKDVDKFERKRAAEKQTLEQITTPQDLSVRARLAAQQLSAGNYEQVVEMTADLEPEQYKEQPLLLELRGKALVLQGNYDAAQSAFLQWTKISPKSAEAFFNYGDSLLRNGDTEAAYRALKQALKINPRHLLSRIAEVKMLRLLNKIDDARRALIQLKEDFGNRVEVLGIAGWLSLNTGDFATAEQEFSEALRQQPSSENVIQLVRAKWAQKKHEESIEMMQQWLTQQPQDRAVLLHLAGAFTTLGRNNDAIAAYEEVAAINPDYVPVLNNLAWLYRDKDLNKSIQYIEKARSLAPEDPFVLDTLGMLVLKKGDVEQAYEFVKKAADRLPNEAQIHLHLSQILIQKGNFSEAEKILNAIVSQLANTEIAEEAKSLLSQIR